MNQTELAEAIKQLSQELHSLITTSVSEQGTTALQQELIKSKCVALYDMLLKLNTVSEKQPPVAVAPPPATPVPPVAPRAPQPEVKTEVKHEPPVEMPVVPPPSLFNDLPSVEIPKQEPTPVIEKIAPVVEKTKTELQNEIIDEIVEIREEEKQKEKSPAPSKEVLSEISLHEKIASAMPNTDLTDRFSSSLSSLKSAINVNLKIALVNELFNENTVDYVKAIDKLNNAENLNEALRFFTELKHTYSWENDNGLVKELESLVNKRYSM